MSITHPHLDAISGYKAGVPIDELKRRYHRDDFAKLNANENLIGPSPKVKEAIIAELDRIHLYPDPLNVELRELLAEQNGVTPEHILIHHGGEAAMSLIAETMLDDESEIVMPTPTFPFFPIASRMMNAPIVEVPLDDFNFDTDALVVAITPDTKIVYIANPNNPTGTSLGNSDYKWILASLPDDAILLHDEAYMEFVERPDYPDAVADVRGDKRVVVLRSLSKTVGLAGMRIGYVIARPDIIAAMRKVRVTFAPNRLAQVAALAALQDTEHIEKTVKTVFEGRKAMAEALSEAGLKHWPSDGNFIFFDAERPATEAFDIFAEDGVIVRPTFGNYVRVTVGLPEHTERFVASLKRMCALAAGYGSYEPK